MSRSGMATFAPTAVDSAAGLTEALPLYYPALDGVRAFCVFFVILYHIAESPSVLSYFEGWLGVDIFFVLSGFLITGLLFREEKLTGAVDLASFYIRRAFRILPLYWLVLAIYVVGLQRPSQIEKWTKMKVALPYFLTFNNDIPFVTMPARVGTTFGLSWTLGVEEKFYFFWPLLCFILLLTLRKRLAAGWMVYAATLLLALFSFKLSWAYSGLIVGAILAMIFSSGALIPIRRVMQKIPASAIVGLLIAGFALVAASEKYVFAFSWIAGLMVASLTLQNSWLSRFLSRPLLVWLGKRSYAMYLIQGFAIDAAKIALKPRNVIQEVVVSVGAFVLAAMGSAVLHIFVEEPAREAGRKIVAYRKARRAGKTADREGGDLLPVHAGEGAGARLVSVIIPTRHRPVLLQRAIDSVNAQTYPDIEIVVFDNCSDEAIRREDIRSKLPVKIVRSESFERLPVSRNRALAACEGSYIAYLDDDDEYASRKLEDQMAVFRQSPDVHLVYGNTEHRSHGGGVFVSSGPPSLNNYLLHQHIHPNSFTVRREVLDSIAFDPKMTTFEDVKFLGTVLRHCRVRHVDSVHAIWYRDGRPDQMTNRNYRRSYENWKRLCEEFRPEVVARVDLRVFYFKKMLLLSLRFMDAQEAARSLRGLLLGR